MPSRSFSRALLPAVERISTYGSGITAARVDESIEVAEIRPLYRTSTGNQTMGRVKMSLTRAAAPTIDDDQC